MKTGTATEIKHTVAGARDRHERRQQRIRRHDFIQAHRGVDRFDFSNDKIGDGFVVIALRCV